MKAIYDNYPCGHHTGDPDIKGRKTFHTMDCLSCQGLDDIQGSAAFFPFREGLYPQLMGSDNTTHFTSKRQLRRESAKRGFYSEYAND